MQEWETTTISIKALTQISLTKINLSEKNAGKNYNQTERPNLQLKL